MLCLKRKKDDYANKAEEEKRIFSLCVRGLKPVDVEKYVYGRRSSLLLLLGRGFCSIQLLILCFCLRGSLPEKNKNKEDVVGVEASSYISYITLNILFFFFFFAGCFCGVLTTQRGKEKSNRTSVCENDLLQLTSILLRMYLRKHGGISFESQISKRDM